MRRRESNSDSELMEGTGRSALLLPFAKIGFVFCMNQIGLCLHDVRSSNFPPDVFFPPIRRIHSWQPPIMPLIPQGIAYPSVPRLADVSDWKTTTVVSMT